MGRLLVGWRNVPASGCLALAGFGGIWYHGQIGNAKITSLNEEKRLSLFGSNIRKDNQNDRNKIMKIYYQQLEDEDTKNPEQKLQ